MRRMQRSLHVVTCCYDSRYQFGYHPKCRCWLARNYHVLLWIDFAHSIIWLWICYLHLWSLVRQCDHMPGYSRSLWPSISSHGRKFGLLYIMQEEIFTCLFCELPVSKCSFISTNCPFGHTKHGCAWSWCTLCTLLISIRYVIVNGTEAYYCRRQFALSWLWLSIFGFYNLIFRQIVGKLAVKRVVVLWAVVALSTIRWCLGMRIVFAKRVWNTLWAMDS